MWVMGAQMTRRDRIVLYHTLPVAGETLGVALGGPRGGPVLSDSTSLTLTILFIIIACSTGLCRHSAELCAVQRQTSPSSYQPMSQYPS